jgi:hypothetical protein
MPTDRNYPAEATQSEIEVFIIESLSMAEEMKSAYEGKALAEALRTLGWRPLYHYVRTDEELETALKLFRHSKYRFLHFSLHGSNTAIFTTLSRVTNDDFAAMTEKKLTNRRLTFSACEVGSGDLVNLLHARNKGVESIAAPLDQIKMHVALPFWLSYYSKVLSEGGLNFKAADLKAALKPLCSYFKLRLNFSHWTPVGEKWNSVSDFVDRRFSIWTPRPSPRR